MRFMVVSRVMPALLTSTSTGPSDLGTLPHPLQARLMIGNVQLVGGYAGAIGELARALVIPGISWRRPSFPRRLSAILIASPIPTGSAGYDRHSVRHESS